MEYSGAAPVPLEMAEVAPYEPQVVANFILILWLRKTCVGEA
jgi:hypothetical protein